MHRKARSLFLPLTLGLLFSFPFTACTSGGGGSSNGGSGSGGKGSGGSGNGGSQNGGSQAGGSQAGGSGGKGGSNNGGSQAGGSQAGGSGGKGGSGGSSAGGAGGGTAGAGGTSAGGAGGGTAGAGGTNPGGAGGGTAGAGGGTSPGGAGGGTNPGTGGGSTEGDMISDFEDTPGKATMIKSGGRTGYWYVYYPKSDSSATPPSGTSMTPAYSSGSPVATEASDSGNALHVKGSGFTGDNNYAGFGGAFKPIDAKKSEAYDVSAYSGISFKIKSGGTAPAVFFEMLTKQNQPTTAGGSAADTNIDLYNTRGTLLNDMWTPGGITTSWKTVTVPFGTLVPRWVPDTTACNKTSTTAMCKNPVFKPTDVLGMQISFYSDPTNGFPQVGTPGTFDIWIDDVQFVKGDTGLQTRTGFPLANSGTWGSCISPVGPSVGAKYLVPAYNQWKKTFVSGNKVIRPENANDTVSEGIAYGMLIAVNMNDKELFDSLYGYWKTNSAAGSLMTWCIPGGGGGTGSACSASGGSATDADEDAAFALLQADKVFGGGSYKSDAMKMIGDIWSKDIDSGTKLPKGGSNYAAPTGTSGTGITNASYFAPAYYTAFKAAGDSNDWAGVNAAVYKSIGTIGGSTGLIPAWCGSSCTAAASNGATNDVNFQYDSHRVPMRLALDYCWNGTADAKTYATKIVNFFSTNTAAGANGVNRILDMYTPAGGNVAEGKPNSASVVGTAAVGAMASGNQNFLNDAYQAVFDAVTRGTMAPVKEQKTPYSYYNATVGMLTLLMMTGNFSH
jgi:endo-1,4-beta-D-glucanase Y